MSMVSLVIYNHPIVKSSVFSQMHKAKATQNQMTTDTKIAQQYYTIRVIKMFHFILSNKFMSLSIFTRAYNNFGIAMITKENSTLHMANLFNFI